MTKTLRDCLLKGGVEGITFDDLNKNDNRNCFNVPIRYSGTYAVLGFVAGGNGTFIDVVDALGEEGGLQGMFKINPHLNDPEYKPTQNTQDENAPYCQTCGYLTVRNGPSYKCLNCGNSE